MKTRKEKIEYLKNLAAGKEPKFGLSENEVWFVDAATNTLTSQKTGKVLTRVEFDELFKDEKIITFR